MRCSAASNDESDSVEMVALVVCSVLRFRFRDCGFSIGWNWLVFVLLSVAKLDSAFLHSIDAFLSSSGADAGSCIGCEIQRGVISKS